MAKTTTENAQPQQTPQTPTQTAPPPPPPAKEAKETLDIRALKEMSINQLVQVAKDLGVEGASTLRKQELIFKILQAQTEKSGLIFAEGVLECLPDGFGFLRAPEYSFHPGSDDVYVSPSQIRRFNLRTGDLVGGQVRAPKENERYFALIKVERVNGEPPEAAREKALFENLTSVWPRRPLPLHDPALRLLSAVAPVGFGQRALVLGGPRTGRSSLLQQLAKDIAAAHPGSLRPE